MGSGRPSSLWDPGLCSHKDPKQHGFLVFLFLAYPAHGPFYFGPPSVWGPMKTTEPPGHHGHSGEKRAAGSGSFCAG